MSHLYSVEPTVTTDQDNFISIVLECDEEIIADALSSVLPTLEEGIIMPQIVEIRSD